MAGLVSSPDGVLPQRSRFSAAERVAGGNLTDGPDVGENMKRLLLTLIVVTLLAPACGNDTTEIGSGDEPEPTTAPEGQADPTPEILAAAAHQLVTVDHTFGSGPPPFTAFLVQERIDPAAGTATAPDGAEARALTADERFAIEQRLAPLGTVTWIADPDDHRTEDLRPTVEGAAIVGLGEPTIDGDTALAPVSLWCGGLCGTWLTYTLTGDADGTWTVDGIEGPIAIS